MSERSQENSERCLEMLAVQCKMARVALGIGVRDLAKISGVSTDTISRLEAGEELKPRTLAAVRSALEAAGIIFTNGDEPGVKLRKAAKGNGSEP